MFTERMAQVHSLGTMAVTSYLLEDPSTVLTRIKILMKYRGREFQRRSVSHILMFRSVLNYPKLLNRTIGVSHPPISQCEFDCAKKETETPTSSQARLETLHSYSSPIQ